VARVQIGCDGCTRSHARFDERLIERTRWRAICTTRCCRRCRARDGGRLPHWIDPTKRGPRTRVEASVDRTTGKRGGRSAVNAYCAIDKRRQRFGGGVPERDRKTAAGRSASALSIAVNGVPGDASSRPRWSPNRLRGDSQCLHALKQPPFRDRVRLRRDLTMSGRTDRD